MLEKVAMRLPFLHLLAEFLFTNSLFPGRTWNTNTAGSLQHPSQFQNHLMGPTSRKSFNFVQSLGKTVTVSRSLEESFR